MYLVVDAMLEFVGGKFRVCTENALVLAGYDNFNEKSPKKYWGGTAASAANGQQASPCV